MYTRGWSFGFVASELLILIYMFMFQLEAKSKKENVWIHLKIFWHHRSGLCEQKKNSEDIQKKFPKLLECCLTNSLKKQNTLYLQVRRCSAEVGPLQRSEETSDCSPKPALGGSLFHQNVQSWCSLWFVLKTGLTYFKELHILKQSLINKLILQLQKLKWHFRFHKKKRFYNNSNIDHEHVQ